MMLTIHAAISLCRENRHLNKANDSVAFGAAPVACGPNRVNDFGREILLKKLNLSADDWRNEQSGPRRD